MIYLVFFYLKPLFRVTCLHFLGSGMVGISQSKLGRDSVSSASCRSVVPKQLHPRPHQLLHYFRSQHVSVPRGKSRDLLEKEKKTSFRNNFKSMHFTVLKLTFVRTLFSIFLFLSPTTNSKWLPLLTVVLLEVSSCWSIYSQSSLQSLSCRLSTKIGQNGLIEIIWTNWTNQT